MALTAKMRELHLLPKWRPTRVHKKSRTQFWLSDSSGIIYHLWSDAVTEETTELYYITGVNARGKSEAMHIQKVKPCISI
jgi:hypothetical protein